MGRLVLRFQIAGMPVVVEPGFWVIALLLGMSRGSLGLLVWIPAVFVSVLVHELGHAFMARALGAIPRITLYTFGGLTHFKYPNGAKRNALHIALVSLAGPAAGFVLAAPAFALLVLNRLGAGSETAEAIAYTFLWINVAWGVINLLPVAPLDGGSVMCAVLSKPGLDTGFVRALWVSVIVGSVVAIVGFKVSLWMGLIFAFFAYSAGKQLLDINRSRQDADGGLEQQLEQAKRAINDKNTDEARRLASNVADCAKSKALRMAATQLLAIVEWLDEKPGSALELMRQLPPDATDPFLYGACLLETGRAAEALPSLEHAVETNAHPAARDLLIAALERSGNVERAEALKRELDQSD